MAISAERLSDLVEAAARVAGEGDLPAVLRTTVATAMDLTGASYGALGVLGEHGTLVEFHHQGLSESQVRQIPHFPEGKGVLGVISRRGETLRLTDVASHPEAVGFPEGHPMMKSFLGVPIRLGEELFGNLYLAGKEEGFGDDDQSAVEALALIAGSAVKTARLHERLRRVAVLEDRERIAGDLHDAIIQDLFAVGLTLQALGLETEPGPVRTGLDDGVRQLDAAITELRRFVFDLHPPVWSRSDLTKELREEAARLAEPHDILVDLKVEGSLNDLPPSLAEDVLQVVREGMSNALRHSAGSKIQVDVWALPREVGVQISDDGIGFDPATVKRGMGLDNLERRADRAGGAFELASAPGEGTTVRISLPRRR